MKFELENCSLIILFKDPRTTICPFLFSDDRVSNTNSSFKCLVYYVFHYFSKMTLFLSKKKLKVFEKRTP